jgi:hypothetical protein
LVHNTETGGGIVALKNLQKGEVYLQVPRKLFMNAESAARHRFHAAVADDLVCGKLPSMVVVLHLIFEYLDPNSHWRPYLDALPKTRSLPFQFDYSEILTLAPSSTMYDALNMKKTAVRQYVHFVNLFKQHARLDLPFIKLQTFEWALATVMARQNNIPSFKDLTKVLFTLVPAMDMCNFKEGEVSLGYNDEIHATESATFEDVKSGDQIYVYYGDRPNSKLFLHQGFVVDGHSSDITEVLLKPDAADPLIKIRVMVWKNLKIMPEQVIIAPLLIGSGPAWDCFLRYADVFVATKEELGSLLKDKEFTNHGLR